jgi:hypothetical protein
LIALLLNGQWTPLTVVANNVVFDSADLAARLLSAESLGAEVELDFAGLHVSQKVVKSHMSSCKSLLLSHLLCRC